MVPIIERQVRFAFRNLGADACEEAVAEAVANAFVAYARLVELGKEDLAYPTVLARYAVAQIRAGRRVGSGQKRNDVLAGIGGRSEGIVMESLYRFDTKSNRWVEATIEDRRTPVPDQAAFRCDFPAWLATHSPRDRQIAESLSMGHSPSEVAQQFRISRARISQLRREFHDSWQEFHGDAQSGRTATVAAA
jgi:hypothetical protein